MVKNKFLSIVMAVLVALSSFSLMAVADIHETYLHAVASTALQVTDKTDTSITIATPAEGYYATIMNIGGTSYSESTKTASSNISVVGDYTTFSNLQANSEYLIRFFNENSATPTNPTSSTTVTTKAAPAPAPVAPSLVEYGSNFITVAAIAGQEYSLDNGATWHRPISSGDLRMTTVSPSMLGGLGAAITPGTNYSVITRVQGTDSAMPSSVSTALSVTTVAVPTAFTLSSVSTTSFGVQVESGVEYKLSTDSTYSTTGVFTNLTPGSTVTLQARYSQSGAAAASEAASKNITLPNVTIASQTYSGSNYSVTPTITVGNFSLTNIQIELTVNNAGNDETPVQTTVGALSEGMTWSLPVSGTLTSTPESTIYYKLKITASFAGSPITLCELAGQRLASGSSGPQTHTHTYNSGTVTKAATCTETGVKTYSCTVTGCTETKTETIPVNPNGHQYDLNNICVYCHAVKGGGSSNPPTPPSSVTHSAAHPGKCPNCGSCLYTGCSQNIGCTGSYVKNPYTGKYEGCNAGTVTAPHIATHRTCPSGHCIEKYCASYQSKCLESKCGITGVAAGGTEPHVPGNLLHEICPKCGSCLYSDCVNYIGCTQDANDCKKNSQTPTGTKIDHVLATHTTCQVCGKCLVTNCKAYVGCTDSVCITQGTQTGDPSTCNHVYKKTLEGVKIPIEVIVAPCSEEADEYGAGSGTFECLLCGDKRDLAIAKSGHVYGDVKTLGQTKVQYCIYCNQMKVLAVCTHDWVLTSVVNCEVSGTWAYECSKCKERKTEAHIPAQHKYGEGVVIKQATETEAGTIVYTCTVCTFLKQETIPAKGVQNPCANGHTFGEWVTTTAATCTTFGSKTRTCTVCNIAKETSSIPATGHAYGAYVVIKQPSCTEAGQRVMSCMNCGDTVTDIIPMLDHIFVEDGSQFVPATCETAGKRVYKCTNCSLEKLEAIAATGKHTYEAKDGVFTCTGCGRNYTVVGTDTTKYVQLSNNGAVLIVPQNSIPSPETLLYTINSNNVSNYDQIMQLLTGAGYVKEEAAVIAGYTINLSDDGNPIKLDSSVQISIPTSADYSSSDVKVFAIVDGGSNLQAITDAKIENNRISLSGKDINDTNTEVIVVLNQKEVTEPKPQGSSSAALPIVLGITGVVVVGGGVGFFLFKKGFFSAGDAE